MLVVVIGARGAECPITLNMANPAAAGKLTEREGSTRAFCMCFISRKMRRPLHVHKRDVVELSSRVSWSRQSGHGAEGGDVQGRNRKMAANVVPA